MSDDATVPTGTRAAPDETALPPLPMKQWGYDREATIRLIEPILTALVKWEDGRGATEQGGATRRDLGREFYVHQAAERAVDTVFMEVSKDITIMSDELHQSTNALIRERQKVADLEKRLEQLVIKPGDEVTTTFRPSALQGRILKVGEVFPNASDFGDLLELFLVPGGEKLYIYAAQCKKVIREEAPCG